MADSQRKTANLFDGVIEQGGYDTSVTPISKIEIQQRCRTSSFIDVSENLNYTASLLSTNDDIQCVIYFLNGSKGKISEVGWSTAPISFTTPNECQYITLIFKNAAGAPISPVNCGLLMVNEGSTPLPYEPNGWQHSLRKLTTATDTITTLPADLYADGNNATVGISGNMSQTGTPTPDNPIQPQGTGDKTANLLDVTLFHNGYHINSHGNIETFTDRIATTTPIDVSNYTSVTFSYTTTRDNDNFIYATFSGNTLVERVAGKTSGFTIDTTNCDKLYLCLYNLSSQVLTADIITAMLNEGSTPLPYEPYGYKIPISSASTTTNVYLGEVESTRRIEKLVLTGEEDWLQSISAVKVYRINVPAYLREIDNIPICTHYKGIAPVAGTGDLQDLETAFLLSASGNNYYYIRDDRFNNANDFKTYLQQQYAAGTPVCVWYVLATPQTAVVNEPLMRIGDYADTLSGITIPTIAGTNRFDVQTTLKPSEVTVNYKGWHPVTDVHERENGAWD